jgi:hypothetical protein
MLDYSYTTLHGDHIQCISCSTDCGSLLHGHGVPLGAKTQQVVLVRFSQYFFLRNLLQLLPIVVSTLRYCLSHWCVQRPLICRGLRPSTCLVAGRKNDRVRRSRRAAFKLSFHKSTRELRIRLLLSLRRPFALDVHYPYASWSNYACPQIALTSSTQAASIAPRLLSPTRKSELLYVRLRFLCSVIRP